MLKIPSFERIAVVSEDAAFAARISALFARPGQYLPILDGPRMDRSDAANEVIRRRNAIAMTDAKKVLIGGLESRASDAMRSGLAGCSVSDDYETQICSLRALVGRPARQFSWGRDNLGVGLYKARLAHAELILDLEYSPAETTIERGRQLLVACERGDPLAEVIASNLAFSNNATFSLFDALPDDDRRTWIEDIYTLGDGSDVTGRFDDIVQRAKKHLGQLDFAKYRKVLFVTAGFPWGIASRETPSTHMYRYPDFGRAVIEGLWASQKSSRSARTALLVAPGTVQATEIPYVKNSLVANGTLTRVVSGVEANVARVQNLLDLVPFDVVVLSSHAGDASGERITYEYPDSTGHLRRLVVDQVNGIGYDVHAAKFRLTQYSRFHSLDGVDWEDEPGKAALSVGDAIRCWEKLDASSERLRHIVRTEAIRRVRGSMAMLLHDGTWLFAPQGFAPGCAPLFINNSCSSWHELSQRVTFAGARAYIGSLFPVSDSEAADVATGILRRYVNHEQCEAVWLAQRDVYRSQPRRPFVMVGLPFVAIRRNVVNSTAFVTDALASGIGHWTARARNSAYDDVRRHSEYAVSFLVEELTGIRQFPPGAPESDKRTSK